jgi:aminobenzoyl-glutamate utilization protein B
VYDGLQKQIWGFAEVGYVEEKSSALLQSQLTAAGFSVQKGVADEPTAFVASYGTGKPVIAILAEFDALPGMSQEAIPERKPIVANAPGHACGHQLFGVGSVAAGIAVKEWLAAGNHPGTIRVYGTPAEEGGSGKVYMVRAGLFDDVDVVIHWHPLDRNQVPLESSFATTSAKFRFHGLAAQAAIAPWKGRSALDALEALDYLVNMMREHIPPDARIHYIITKGGAAPNIVPEFAEVWIQARHPNVKTLDEVWARIVNAAKAAALGTDTTLDFEIIHAVYNELDNEYLGRLQQRNLERVGGIKYTAEEQAFAEKLAKTLPPDPEAPLLPLGSEQKILPLVPMNQAKPDGGSTDVADVSWVVPVVGLNTACFVPGTNTHSWQAVAAGGTTIGTKGMVVATKTMALTAVDLFSSAEHIQKAREEWLKRRGDFVYKARVGDRKPPLDYRKY